MFKVPMDGTPEPTQHELTVRRAIEQFPLLWHRLGELEVECEVCREHVHDGNAEDREFWASEWLTKMNRADAIVGELMIVV